MSIYNYTWCPIFKALALWANAFYKLKFLSFKIRLFWYSWCTRKPRLPLVQGHIANFGIFLDVFKFLCF